MLNPVRSRYAALTFLCAPLLLAGCGSGPGEGDPVAQPNLSTTVAPGGNFALDHWTLTIPKDPDGGSSGVAKTYQATEILGADGYTSPWFYTGSDGSMTFFTPEDGAGLDTGASHPRSELREQIVEGENAPNWDQHGLSVLEAELQIDAVPSDNKVIIGQSHGHAASPLMIFFYQYNPSAGFGTLVGIYHVDPTQGSEFQRYKLIEGLRLGERFRYRMVVNNGIASMQGDNNPPVVIPMHAEWEGTDFYFKAGAYLGVKSSAPTAAKARFYRLAAYHPNEGLDITTPAVLPPATIGQPYSQTFVAAAGAGSGYVWQVSSGRPPSGLSLDPATGLLSGAPVLDAGQPKLQRFTVMVRDPHNNSMAKEFQLALRS